MTSFPALSRLFDLIDYCELLLCPPYPLTVEEVFWR